MAGSGKKWAIGCGIGCGLILLLIGGIGTVGYFGVREVVKRAETIEEAGDELVAEYGQPDEFQPRADGVIPADRIEAFLAVRQGMMPARTELGELLAVLGGDEEAKKSASMMNKITAGLKLVPSLLTFAGERNRVLLAEGMGLGEYMYVYTLSYYVLLEHDPTDGPDFKVTGPDDEDEGSIHWNVQTSSGGDVYEQRDEHVRTSMNNLMTDLARNQLRALEAIADDEFTDLPSGWRQDLATELELMEDERLRLLWEEGLPAQIRQSLEPYRGRLDAEYDPLLNAIEAGITDHH